MQVELGARVHFQDGQDIGHIKHLILDPINGHIRSIVVERGRLLKEDTEIPLDAVQAVESNEVHVAYTEAQIKDLPHFDASRYTEAPPEGLARLFPFPSNGLLWPEGYASAAYPTGMLPALLVLPPEGAATPPPTESEEIAQQVERENVVIEVGDDVLSQEGERVGTVQNVIFDPSTGRLTALVVRVHKGFLSSETIQLPAQDIASFDDEVVTLKITKAQLAGRARSSA